MAGLLSMLNGVYLADKSLRALIAHKREDGRVDIFILRLAHFGQLKHTLVCLLICGCESSDGILGTTLLVDAEVVMSAVEKNVNSLGQTLVVIEHEHFAVLDHDDAEFNIVKVTYSLELRDATPSVRSAR